MNSVRHAGRVPSVGGSCSTTHSTTPARFAPRGRQARGSAAVQSELGRTEHRLHRPGFRQHVDHPALAARRGGDDGLVEHARHEDAAERNKLVVAARPGQALRATLVGRGRLGGKTPDRRGALGDGQVGRRAAVDVRFGEVGGDSESGKVVSQDQSDGMGDISANRRARNPELLGDGCNNPAI